MAEKSLSELADTTIREQKAASTAAAAEVVDKKERFRRRVEQEVRKHLRVYQHRITALRDRLFILKQDIESVNPRFQAIQLHTKSKWVTELDMLLTEFDALLFELSSDDLHLTWEE